MKKIVTLFALLLCITTSAAYAEQSVQNEKIIDLTPVNGVVPFSTYFKSGTLNINRNSASVSISLTTSANQTVSHIYHDVTVYKNDTWISSERYENWNKKSLSTSFNVSATSGDYIDVYVDHYTSHNGTTEVGHNHKSLTF